MTAADENSRFINAAQSQGMLTEQFAKKLLSSASDTDIASTMVLKQGLMDARQVDMIQTLISGQQSIPGYTIIDIIGHGGMGVVFRAHQHTLDRDVALKMVLVGGRLEESIQRFRNEATSVARLNHANIVTAFDSGQHDGRIFLSMELVEGQDLTGYVEQQHALPAEEALRITRQAALGLAHAWEHGIVHRDIKPDNLLITRPSEFDQSRTVKITDLGLAHLAADSDASRLTQTGAVVGSPLYMSPEQLSTGNVDCRSDIYSLGSTLYFMLSGQAPFQGDSIASILYNKAAGNSIPLTEVANVDERVVAFVAQMMSTEPEERIQDYRSVVSQIDTLLESVSSAIVEQDSAATQIIPRSIPNSPNPSLQNTRTIGSDTSAESRQTQQPRHGNRMLQLSTGVLAALTIIGSFFIDLSDHPSGIPTRPSTEQVDMKQTWGESLFNGQSLEGWTNGTPGTQWEVTADPLENAFALAGTARANQSGSIRTRIPVADHANHADAYDQPWFEIEFSIILHSAAAAGFEFGMADSTPGYRLRITQDNIRLLNEESDSLVQIDTPASMSENPLQILLRLQPTGWLIQVDGKDIATAPATEELLPEIRLFVESGQAFFSGINAYGLRLPVENPTQRP